MGSSNVLNSGNTDSLNALLRKETILYVAGNVSAKLDTALTGDIPETC